MGQIRTRDQEPAGTREPILETRTRILDSTKESINFVGSQALEAARRGGFREAIVDHIGLAVHEIMTNAVIHGNRGNLHKKVVVTISRTPNKSKIEIADEGDGFDLIVSPIHSRRKSSYMVLAVVSIWLARLWTNSMCDANLWAGLR